MAKKRIVKLDEEEEREIELAIHLIRELKLAHPGVHTPIWALAHWTFLVDTYKKSELSAEQFSEDFELCKKKFKDYSPKSG